MRILCGFMLIAAAYGQYVQDEESYQEQPQAQYTPTQYITLQQSQQNVPVYQTATGRSSRPRVPPPPPPPSPPPGITQLLLPSSVDQQIQRAANHLAGPEYAQQVQNVQLQSLADQATAVAQRRAQVTAQRIQQANRQAQAQSQPQYISREESQSQYAVEPSIQYVTQQHQPRAQASKNVLPKEDYDPNPSYQFGFDVKDDLNTNYQNRKEQRDGQKITGSYSVVDADGFIRTVTYTADPKEGFKAEVNRQPTDIVIKFPKPASPNLKQQQYIQDTQDVRSQGQPKYIYQYQQ